MFKVPLLNLTGKNKTDIDTGKVEEQDLKSLLELCFDNLPSVDEQRIVKAFRWCFEAHKNNMRRSGLPYYSHPVEVAKIVATEIPLDDVSVICALLHDVLGYSDRYSLKDIRNEFGSTVSEIVDGISKIRHIEGHGLDHFEKLENYEKLLLSMFKDVRIILIKLADRLHNMRTLEFLAPERQKNMAKETLDIYSFLAHRFGLGNIKWELEDIAFRHLYKEAYDEIKESINQTRKERETYIKKFTAPLKDKIGSDELLKNLDVKFDITGRPKHMYSTYQKLNDRGFTIDQLNDLYAIRIILDTEDRNLCFYVYGIVCDKYPPIPGTFKNYIYNPKKNGYQSLHTAVIGPENRHVEVQVRTRTMHQIAEKGVAAHFVYKKGHVTAENILEDDNLQKWMDSVREIFENIGDETPQQLIESVNQNLFHDEIYVFTSSNDLRLLPKDSTVLDFAFDIHSEIGYHCVSAKVNGKIVALDYKLKNGDQVKILTSDNAQPSKDWLKYVATTRAKSLIHKYLKDSAKKVAAKGKELWEEKLKSKEIKINDIDFLNLILSMNFKDKDDFYISVGMGKFDIDKRLEYIFFKLKEGIKSPATVSSKDLVNTLNNETTNDEIVKNKISPTSLISVKYSQCCNPIPGDKILGIISGNEKINIHRRECDNIELFLKDNKIKFIELEWNKLERGNYFADLKITANDRPALLNDITQAIISCEKTNIKGVKVETNNMMFEGYITINVNDIEHLNRIFDKIYSIEGIKSIERLKNR